MGAFKDFVTGMANAKILPAALTIDNLDKSVKVKVYRKDNETDDKNIGTYGGKLEAFWSNDHAVVIKLKGLEKIVTTWEDHHIDVERY
jgi:hypothetical protein